MQRVSEVMGTVAAAARQQSDCVGNMNAAASLQAQTVTPEHAVSGFKLHAGSAGS